MIYIVKINNKEYEVEVEKGQASIVSTAQIDSSAVPAPVSAHPAPVPPPASPSISPASPQTSTPVSAPSPMPQPGVTVIKAPIPGTVLDIKAAPGQTVKKGEQLVILEAMKMENEIVSPVDGVIAQVHVAKGSSVATDDNLMTIQ